MVLVTFGLQEWQRLSQVDKMKLNDDLYGGIDRELSTLPRRCDVSRARV